MAQSLPSIVSGEGGLSRYLEEIRRFPMLQPQEEYMLAKRYQEHQDTNAAHKLVTSHLRLVAKIAMGYRGYGLPIGEVISEGNVGLMQAVKKFEPERGFRLATYAMWWIKAAIQEYILRSWSLVKMGTTANQKRLFFNLRKVKGKIQALDEGDLKPEQVAEIATRLNVSEEEVVSMNRRLSGDASLNSPIRATEGESGEWQDWLVDDHDSQEEMLIEQDELESRRAMLTDAMSVLNDRERRIFEARRLADEPMTLEELSAEFDISRERVRQIEVRAFEKVQDAVKAAAKRQAQALRTIEAQPTCTDRSARVRNEKRRPTGGVFVRARKAGFSRAGDPAALACQALIVSSNTLSPGTPFSMVISARRPDLVDQRHVDPLLALQQRQVGLDLRLGVVERDQEIAVGDLGAECRAAGCRPPPRCP